MIGSRADPRIRETTGLNTAASILGPPSPAQRARTTRASGSPP